ncbi:MAG: alpha/beta hydrolase [Actinomycetaceae bacterium]|nr:alpha/beta hydrolase [Actinomycetaceae bacterium]
MVNYTVTNSLVAVDGIKVRVRRFRRDFLDEGEPTFVLVHGIGVNSDYFINLAHDLVEFGDVVAMDLPGFGQAPQPDEPLSIAGFAAVVHQVMRYEKVRNPVVLGHSMGAQVVTELAARAPGWVDRIMLIGPPVNAAERSPSQVAWRFIQSSVHEPSGVAVFAVTAYLRCGLVWFLKTVPTMLTYPVRMRLADAGARTVLMRGEFDFIAAPRWVEDLRIAARERTGIDARVVEVPGGAHSVIVDHADLVADELLKLARQPRPPRGTRVRRESFDTDVVQASADAIDEDDSVLADPWEGTAGAALRDLDPDDPAVKQATGIADGSQNVFEALTEHAKAAPSLGRRLAVIGYDYGVSAAIKLRHAAQKAGVVGSVSMDSFRRPGAPVAVGLPGVLENWRYLTKWAQALYDDGWDVHLLDELHSMTGPLQMLSRRVDAYLERFDLEDVYFFAHSKGGLVGKMSMVGPERERVAGMVSVASPYAGSSVAHLAPTIMGVWDLRPEDPAIREQFADLRANNRIVSLQSRWDQHVPSGSWLPGAQVVELDAWGHNSLLESKVVARALVEHMSALRDA